MFGQKKFQPYRYVKTTARIVRVRRQTSDTFLSAVGYATTSLALLGMLFLASPLIVTESILLLQKLNRQLTSLAFMPNSDALHFPVNKPMPTPDPATLPFSISIPKLELEAKVIANVDASNQSIYSQALKEGVAHGLGSAFPGQGKLVYIFGHSTDYAWNVSVWNALFYQIKDLEAGDSINLSLGTKTYAYTVIAKHIVTPTDISLIEQNQDNDLLILQTCYPPGTDWQRLLIVAEPAK